MIVFKWDDNKNKIIVPKHGVSFKEALTVFYDDNALLINDETHSAEEDRFILVGLSAQGRIIVVCHAYYEEKEIIRIISSREATKNETLQYLRKKESMKKEYDFSGGKKNPYVNKLKKQITINLNEEVLTYFKAMSDETGIPYQSLINLYLLDCVNNKKTLRFE